MTSRFNTIQGIAELVLAGETVNITVKGRSMSPTFRDGKDIISISPVGGHILSRGDVVLFDRGDNLCVHRILERKGDRLVIRGDGNSIRALEYASVNDVKGIILSGTFRNGKVFTVEDEAWKRNTDFVLRHAKTLSAWHRFTGILRRYPMSIVVLTGLLYLSFFNPGQMQMTLKPGADKIIHSLMYFLCSTVFWTEWLHRHKLTKRNCIVGILPCVLLPAITGGLAELGQKFFTDYRSGDIYDFLANLLGIFCAWAVSMLFTRPLIRAVRNHHPRR